MKDKQKNFVKIVRVDKVNEILARVITDSNVTADELDKLKLFLQKCKKDENDDEEP